MPEIPPSRCPRSVTLTLWSVVREGRQIICRPHGVTGPIEVGGAGRPVPPELLARTIPPTADLEDPACR
jgi:hypothetical protein